ncbi:MAG: hypothetical protein WBA57_27835 [Elainellaceae cyanobacterium]
MKPIAPIFAKLYPPLQRIITYLVLPRSVAVLRPYPKAWGVVKRRATGGSNQTCALGNRLMYSLRTWAMLTSFCLA